MIHCALLGSLERFLSVYIEHTAGKFPVWVAPEQLRIIKVKDAPVVDAMVDRLVKQAQLHQIRYTVDDSNGSIGKKIRSAELYKVPYAVVIGDREAESGRIGVRIRKDLVGEATDEVKQFTPSELMEAIQTEHDRRTKLSTL